MSLTQLKEACSHLKPSNVREDSDTYWELVLRRTDLDAWLSALEASCGKAVKPLGEKPDNKAQKLTKAFGGIWEDQALFYQEGTGNPLMVMLWPWQDGVNITLKGVIIEK